MSHVVEAPYENGVLLARLAAAGNRVALAPQVLRDVALDGRNDFMVRFTPIHARYDLHS